MHYATTEVIGDLKKPERLVSAEYKIKEWVGVYLLAIE